MVIERQHSPNIGNDDVHALRQFRLARVTLEKLDAVRETVRGRELPRKFNTVFRLDRENTPGPQPISATVSPGRTAPAIALAYAPKRPASAIISPKSRSEYISAGGNPGGGVMSGRYALRVRDDQLTKRADTYRVQMRHDPPYRHPRDELAERVKFCGALSPVQQPVHVSILHEIEKRPTSGYCFYPRCIGLCDPRSKEIHRAHNSPLLLEYRIPAIQRQKKLLPTGCQPRQRVPRAKQFLYRLRPKANAGITRFNLKSPSHFDQWSYVFTQDGDSSQCKGRRHRGLARLALAAQRDGLSPDAYGAGMESQDTPASQK